jgi:outer membrane biosynthesis protein TonB
MWTGPRRASSNLQLFFITFTSEKSEEDTKCAPRFFYRFFPLSFLIGMSVAQTTPAATTSQNSAQSETNAQQPSPQPATPQQAEPTQPTSPENTAPSQGAESPQSTAPSQGTEPPQNTVPSQATQPPQSASPDTGTQPATPPNQATPDQNQQPPNQNPPSQNQPPENNNAASPTQPSASTSPTATSEGANTDASEILSGGNSEKWLGKPVTLTNVTVQDTTETGNFWVGTDDAHRILIVKPASDANLRSIQVQKGETVTISGTVRPADDFMASMTGTDKTVMSNAKSASGVFLLAEKVITPANQH